MTYRGLYRLSIVGIQFCTHHFHTASIRFPSLSPRCHYTGPDAGGGVGQRHHTSWKPHNSASYPPPLCPPVSSSPAGPVQVRSAGQPVSRSLGRSVGEDAVADCGRQLALSPVRRRPVAQTGSGRRLGRRGRQESESPAGQCWRRCRWRWGAIRFERWVGGDRRWWSAVVDVASAERKRPARWPVKVTENGMTKQRLA